MSRIYTNFAKSTLASGIAPAATSITVAAGDGALFPAAGAGATFDAVIYNSAAQREIVSCTSRTGDVLTVTRAQQGTSALTWNAADKIGHRLTKDALNNIIFADNAQQNSFTWCGTAGGTANALTLTPSPAVTAMVAGHKFIFKSGAAANTTPVTIAVSGLATFAAQNNGTALVAGDIEASKWYEVLFDGTAGQLKKYALGINNTLIDAKGDLIVGTAADTVARKAVGTDGQSIIADSAQSDGLLYVSTMPIPQGRLTLSSGSPVDDKTGQTTLYYTPYQGNTCPIYNGTVMVGTTFAEISQATTDASKSPAAVAASKVYDIFVWNDAGTIRATRGPAWTNDTTRGYTLTMTNGILLNTSAITNGPAALRGTFVGTVYSDASSQLNDSAAKRNVWNTYNRVDRHAANTPETANTWSYSTATIRQANANTANQFEYVCGSAEDSVSSSAEGIYSTDTAGELTFAGIGADSTTVFPTTGWTQASSQIMVAANNAVWSSSWVGNLGIGKHFIAWLERGSGTGTTTWSGDRGGLFSQAGITGTVRA